MKKQICLFIYRFIFVPIISFLAFILSIFIPKVRKGLKERLFSNEKWSNDQKIKNCYWFHCSSGELEYAKPVMKLLKEQEPDCQILLTWFSPSVKLSAKKFSYIDAVYPSPWEFPWSWAKFLNKFQPKALLIARTDIWTEMLLQAQKHKVPSLLFSATLVSDSGRMNNPISRYYYSWAHNLISEVYCVTEEDKLNYLQLSPSLKVKVMGDTRYDQVIERLNQKNDLKVSFKASAPTLLCGSTWEEDEAEILKAIHRVGLQNVNLILVPHEPSEKHLQHLQKKILHLGMESQLYSSGKEWTGNKILIIDAMGILANLYPMADIAFIGGSYKGSIHSVMEGLAAGKICLFGPHYKNNREAIYFKDLKIDKDGQTACVSLENADEMEAFLNNENWKAKNQIYSNNIKAKINEFTGSTKAVQDWVHNLS